MEADVQHFSEKNHRVGVDVLGGHGRRRVRLRALRRFFEISRGVQHGDLAARDRDDAFSAADAGLRFSREEIPVPARAVRRVAVRPGRCRRRRAAAFRRAHAFPRGGGSVPPASRAAGPRAGAFSGARALDRRKFPPREHPRNAAAERVRSRRAEIAAFGGIAASARARGKVRRVFRAGRGGGLGADLLLLSDFRAARLHRLFRSGIAAAAFRSRGGRPRFSRAEFPRHSRGVLPRAGARRIFLRADSRRRLRAARRSRRDRDRDRHRDAEHGAVSGHDRRAVADSSARVFLGRNSDAVRRVRRFLRRAADGVVFSHAENHGQAHGAASDGHHARDLLLGDGARRLARHGFRRSADGVLRRVLAAFQGAVSSLDRRSRRVPAR